MRHTSAPFFLLIALGANAGLLSWAIPAAAQAIGQLPTAECLASAAAGLPISGNDVFTRNLKSPSEIASQMLKSAFDGAPGARGCSIATLTTAQRLRVAQSLPRVRQEIERQLQTWTKKRDDAQKTVNQTAKDLDNAGKNRKQVDVLQRQAEQVGASCPACQNAPDYKAAMNRFSSDGEKWNQRVIDLSNKKHDGEAAVSSANGVCTQMQGLLGQLSQLEANLNAAK